MNLYFYDVSSEYVNYLKAEEQKVRGFTRVPDVEYNNERKMVCGIVMQICNFKYYVPVSSYKIRQKNNILIELKDDKFNPVKGSLRFNYMFPVPDQCVTIRNFASSVTKGRAEFLRRQWIYCNKIEADIKAMAQKTYKAVVNKTDAELVSASCDFALLESAMLNYCK